ncbi:hypothetical protein D3C81_1284090 [compost metagenome]
MYAGMVWIKSRITSLTFVMPAVSPMNTPAGMATTRAMTVELNTSVSVLMVSAHNPMAWHSHSPNAAPMANTRPTLNQPRAKAIVMTAQYGGQANNQSMALNAPSSEVLTSSKTRLALSLSHIRASLT